MSGGEEFLARVTRHAQCASVGIFGTILQLAQILGHSILAYCACRVILAFLFGTGLSNFRCFCSVRFVWFSRASSLIDSYFLLFIFGKQLRKKIEKSSYNRSRSQKKTITPIE